MSLLKVSVTGFWEAPLLPCRILGNKVEAASGVVAPPWGPQQTGKKACLLCFSGHPRSCEDTSEEDALCKGEVWGDRTEEQGGGEESGSLRGHQDLQEPEVWGGPHLCSGTPEPLGFPL